MLTDYLSLVEDPRSHINREHDLVDVMFLVINGVLSGAEGWADLQAFGDEKLEWLRQFRPFKNGIPTRHSIARILRTVDTQQLALALYSWVNEQRKRQDQAIIALDGKTVRGAVNRNANPETLHLVSAYDTQEGLVLFQQATGGKGTEIQAVKELLSMLDINGSIVTLDALHCQSQTLNQITLQGGDYVVQLKKNQGKLREAISTQFTDVFEGKPVPNLSQHTTSDQGHGREEVRTVFQLPITEEMGLEDKWKSAKSTIVIERSRKLNDKTTYDTHFYISSLVCDAELACKAIRQHWHIENQQHWVLDVVYREDHSLIGDREAAEVFALFRRIAMNLAKHHKGKMSNRQKLKRAGWSDEFRAELFFC